MNLSVSGLFPSGILTRFPLGEYRASERKAANPPTNVSLLNYSCSWFGGIKTVFLCGIADPGRGCNDLLQLIRSSLGRMSCAQYNDFLSPIGSTRSFVAELKKAE